MDASSIRSFLLLINKLPYIDRVYYGFSSCCFSISSSTLSYIAGPLSVVGSISDSRTQVRYTVRPHILVSPLADSRRAVVSYWRKNVHRVLVDRLGEEKCG